MQQRDAAFALLSENKDQYAYYSAQRHTTVFRCSAVRHAQLGNFGECSSVVVPAWSAGTQVHMDVSGRIPAELDAGSPCRHDGCDAMIVSGICRLFANRRTSFSKRGLGKSMYRSV
jgi:hypothetical protein